MMQPVIEWFGRNALYLFIGGFILSLYLNYKRRQKQKAIIEEEQNRVHTDAMAAGIKVSQTATGRISNEKNPYGDNPEIGGTTLYEGTDEGMAWRISSEIYVTNRSSSENNRSSLTEVRQRSTRFKTDAVKTPANNYVMLMSTPGAYKKKPKGTGFWGSIVNTVADKALDFYINNYFGSGYAAMVNVNRDTIVDIPELESFFIITNNEPLALQFLNKETVNILLQWKKETKGFAQEGAVDQLGFLFAHDGAVAGCMAAMHSADEAKKLARFAVAVSTQMKKVISKS